MDPVKKLADLKEENERLQRILAGVYSQWKRYSGDLDKKADEYRDKMNKLREQKKKEIQDNKLVMQNYKSGGNKVFIADELWKVVITIMSGIEMSVRAFDFETKQYTTSEKECKAKNIFEINHSSLENYKKAQFIDFAPTIFNYLRKQSGIFPDQYIESLGPECLSKVIAGNLDTFEGLTSAGKSGSLFFTSADKKYLVKTISKEEYNHFLKILPYYVQHIVKNPLSLVNRIYGLHQIVMKAANGETERFTIVVMQNIMCTTNYICSKYDLKGSTYKRITKGNIFHTIPGKDLNFIESKLKFVITQGEYRELVDQLRKDVDFLASQNIIDYSLLIGIHDKSISKDPANSPSRKPNVTFKIQDTIVSHQTIQAVDNEGIRRNLNTFETCDRKVKIYCGIIDIFTVFNMRKKSEYVLKRCFLGQGVSCVPPKFYAERFLGFMSNSVFEIGEPVSPVSSQSYSPMNQGHSALK